MRNLVLVGGGGHFISCLDIILMTKLYKIVGIIDKKKISFRNIKYLGDDERLNDIRKKSSNALITIGQIHSPNIRISLYKKLKDLNFKMPIITSPNSTISKFSSINEGTIIMNGSILNANSKIGNNCIINTGSIIEHDVLINDHCHISTGVILNGNVTIGKGTFIGSGTVIKEGVSIGSNCVIGSNQNIKKNIKNFEKIK